MGSYARKVKRQNESKEKAPRCHGQRMFMNKYGLWQCRRCGAQKFYTGSGNPMKDESEPEVIDETSEISE